MQSGPDQAAIQFGRPGPPAIEIAGLSHWYGEGKMRRQVLEGVDLSIASGEVVLLTGPQAKPQVVISKATQFGLSTLFRKATTSAPSSSAS